MVDKPKSLEPFLNVFDSGFIKITAEDHVQSVALEIVDLMEVNKEDKWNDMPLDIATYNAIMAELSVAMYTKRRWLGRRIKSGAPGPDVDPNIVVQWSPSDEASVTVPVANLKDNTMNYVMVTGMNPNYVIWGWCRGWWAGWMGDKPTKSAKHIVVPRKALMPCYSMIKFNSAVDPLRELLRKGDKLCVVTSQKMEL